MGCDLLVKRAVSEDLISKTLSLQLAAGSQTAIKRDSHAVDDLGRHQEALDIVFTFAALLHEDMAMHTHGQADGQNPEVAEACAELAGMTAFHLCMSLLIHKCTLLQGGQPLKEPCPESCLQNVCD